MPKDRVRGVNSSQEGRRRSIMDSSKLVLQSVHSKKPVWGLTHTFYRYPARFSPEFARSIINAFSKPGDTILDPFMGGGTTVVEGLAMGRKVVGIDLNPLAVFIARVKSTPLSESEIGFIIRFMKQFHIHLPCFQVIGSEIKSKFLFKNVPWWIRNRILAVIEKIENIRNPRVRAFLRCGLLKTSQWALDCKEVIPSSQQFLQAFLSNVNEMCNQMEEYQAALDYAGISTSQQVSKCRRILLRSAATADQDQRIPLDWLPIKLVVTSPPYPGVHVLYHRWQVQGRRETPAPFAIINSLDGQFPSYYTLADRRRVEPYFRRLTAAYRSIANLLSPCSLVVQLVSFNNPKRDINRFLDAMEDAGFEECPLKDFGLGPAERVWRLVPNRKWYVGYRSDFHAGKELLLLHRIKRK